MGYSDRSLKSRRLCWLALVAAVFTSASMASAPQTRTAESELQEYLIVGTVLWTDPGAASISIRGARLLGYLHMQVSSYRVKQPSTLIALHPGDKVTAIFSRKDGMLHRLRRIQAAAKGGPAIKRDSQ
jgi:Cu/Ag efflux protein CusF